ncbi:hypothetical protein PIB30_058631 [Stylosanthes scabra]|uniref:Uncharacterized protein n=1 Tax=Stylosanthes scabra TaxID=79078 RepID=A0ABU6RKM1_9FABA|nr:hypothetical protein [Stylosanthes scabra]
MFDSFDTVSLGRDESNNVAVEGPGVVPSEPPHKETEIPHENTTDAGEKNNTEVEVPHIPESVEREEPQRQEPQHEEPQPEPLVVIMPIHSDQPPKSSDSTVDIPPLAEDIQDTTEPEPLTVVIPLELEPKLTLRPWLQDEAGTSAEKDPTKSADDMITGVRMSMK